MVTIVDERTDYKGPERRRILRGKEIDNRLTSHERALFGFWDNESLRYVPGLLSRMDDMQEDVGNMKKQLDGVPEAVRDVRTVKKWGAWAVAAILALLLAQTFGVGGVAQELIRLIPHP